MLSFVINGLIKLLPAIIGNTAPVLTAKLFPKLNYPVDFNKKLKDGKRLFGSHKTWRGVATMILMGMAVGNYTIGLHYGLMMGIGVVIGDLLTSYIKRRREYKPGESFQPQESILFIMGVISFTLSLWSPLEVITLLLLTWPIYKLFHYLGYWLRLKTNPW